VGLQDISIGKTTTCGGGTHCLDVWTQNPDNYSMVIIQFQSPGLFQEPSPTEFLGWKISGSSS
jgi:hypothetical protein